jgi:SAM-dependent methyltransferase
MLSKAKERDAGLRPIRGRAGRLPFPTAAFDLAFCVNAIHHFVEQRRFVFEARRLLRSSGALAVVGMDPHGRRDHWYVYDTFDSTYQTDLERFPSWGEVMDWMTAAGFGQVAWRVVERINDPKFGREVLDDPFLRKESTSQLALLTDDAYAEGLHRIRAALDTADETGEQLVFRSDILMGMVVGQVLG